MEEKNTFLSVRLGVEDKNQLQKLCEISGLTPSQLVRQLLHGTTIRQKPSAQLRELFVEVNRIGNNVNQIARKVNGNIGSKEDVAELQLLLHTIVKLVDGLGR